jgi:hypothetical protein
MDFGKFLRLIGKQSDELVPAATRQVDELAEEALPATRKSTIPTEVGPEVIGEGQSRATKQAADAIDAEFTEITPTTGMEDMTFLNRIDPRLVNAAKAFGKGGAVGAGAGYLASEIFPPGEEEQVQIPFRPEEKKMEQPTQASVPEQKAAAPQPISPTQRKVSVDVAEKVQQATPEQAESDFLNALMAGQRATIDNQFSNALLRAATQAGAAIAGSGARADYNVVDALDKTVSQPEQIAKTAVDAKKAQQSFDKTRLELQDEAKLRDPNSSASKMAKRILSKYGLNVNTAKEAQDAGINIQNILLQEMASQRAKELAEIQSGKSVSKKTTDFVKGAQKALLKPYQEFQKVDNAYKSLQTFADDTKMQAGPKDVAMLYDFIKTLDPGSVVREGEIALTRQGMSQLEALGLKINRITKSDLLTPEFRQGIAQIAKAKRDQAFEAYNQIRQPYIQEAESVGLKPEDFDRFDYGAGAKTETPEPAGKKTVKLGSSKKPGTIVTTKSGKSYRVNEDGMTATEL